MIQSITNIYQSRPKEFNRFAKFALVGAIGTVIDFSVLYLGLYLFRDVFHWNLLSFLSEYGLNGNLLCANTLSVGVAMFSNFIWNRYWTFPESRSRRKRTQLPQFVLVNLIGLLLNNLIVVGIDAVLVAHVGEPWSFSIGKAIAIGVVLFWNFGANRLWTYRGL